MRAINAVLFAAALAGALGATAVRAGPCSELQSELGFPHCVELGPQPGVYAVAWQTDATNIWLALDLTTDSATAWAGFGLSEGGGMKGSDLIVVAKQAAGGLLVQDMWSEQFALPGLDSSQDVVLVAPLAPGQLADAATPTDVAARLMDKPGRLRVLLRRKLEPCDTRDLAITPGLPQPVVWAYGADWPTYHGTSTRGDSNINFVPLEGDSVVPTGPTGQLPPNTATLDLVMPNVTIPTNTTSYLCTHFHLPEDKKYHITAYEGVINSPLVHHIILYACSGPQPATGDVVDCLQMEPQCATYLVGWAPGINYFEFPKEAGIPIGKGPAEDNIPSWFSIQVHYNNPDGIVSAGPDASGIRITYTSDLRPHDMGVLSLMQNNLYLPPGKSQVVAGASICPSDCTAKLAQPVTMLYTLLHMHQTGTSITTRHIRDGVELPPLGRRRVWDFNYQAMAPIPFESRELRPGDVLITQCVFNTVGRTGITTFGQGTLDEMCIDFVTYYPRSKIELCFNNPPVMGPDGKKINTAVCAPSTIGGGGEGGGAMTPENMSPEQYMMSLVEKGYIVNSTWPGAFTKFTQPACQAAAAQALGV